MLLINYLKLNHHKMVFDIGHLLFACGQFLIDDQ